MPKSMKIQTFQKKLKCSKLFVLQKKTWFWALKMYENSIQNQCKIDARKSYAKSMKNDANIEANGGQDRLKIQKYAKKGMAKIDAEF